MQPHVFEELAEKTGGYPFDFVLASRHVYKKDEGEMFPMPGRHKRDELFREYLRMLIGCIHMYDDFDCLSHLTYFSRAVDFDPPEMTYRDAPEELDELFRLLIGKNKGIEVNTSSYAKRRFSMPDYSIVKRFCALGGEVITVGSDSHVPAGTGAYIKEALTMMKEAGVRYVCTFGKRTPSFHPMDRVMQRGNA
jgi:histidinol-phosphatase (PHP family)